ncbi:DUF3348 family protein [Paraburkholderia jirisanensis]
MMQLPQRSPYSGAALVRVLARLAQTGVPASDVSLPDRLSQWLGWTDAIALSSALDAGASAPAGAQTARGDATVATLEAALCARARATLTDAIDACRPGAKIRRGGASIGGRDVATRNRVETRIETGVEADAGAIGFAPFGQQYQAQQQSMETAIDELRNRLRAMLATRGEAHARLALVDATMARALDARERTLLGTVPSMLEAHFVRLRDTAIAAEEAATQARDDEAAHPSADEAENGRADEAANEAMSEAANKATEKVTEKAAEKATVRGQNTAAAPPASAWLDAFREDMHAVLLAELDVRFQPVEGLLAALRAR